MSDIRIAVPEDIRSFFTESVITGHGGFQAVSRLLAERLATSTVLHLDREEFSRVVRYASHFGEGGFQARLRKIVVSWVSQHLDELV